jgi:hypothetical protein
VPTPDLKEQFDPQEAMITIPRKNGKTRLLEMLESAPMPKERDSVLQEADRIINGARRDDYGTPLSSFAKVARLWEPILGVEISPYDVALCMILFKVGRATNGMQRDSVVDIAGYAGCIELMKREEGQW